MIKVLRKSSFYLLTITATTFCADLALSATVVNGDFESGLSNWSTVDIGSGFWSTTDSSTSPISGSPIPGGGDGSFISVTDQIGPSSHVLFQDISLEAGQTHALSFDWFAQDQSGLGPIDAGTMNPLAAANQHFRVDVMEVSFSDWFGSNSSDGVLANVLAPTAETLPVSGFNTTNFDLTPWAGSDVRLAFRQVDNLFFFQAGVDNVRIQSSNTNNTTVPEPASVLGLLALFSFGCVSKKRKL